MLDGSSMRGGAGGEGGAGTGSTGHAGDVEGDTHAEIDLLVGVGTDLEGEGRGALIQQLHTTEGGIRCDTLVLTYIAIMVSPKHI